MMAMSTIADLYVSDEELDALEVGDTMVDITGAIIRSDDFPMRTGAVRAANQPYRVVFHNGRGRWLRVLFWGDRIPEFQGKIIGQVVRITRGRVRLANPTYRRSLDNLMAIEVFIQPHSGVELLGPMPEAGVEPTQYVTINFDQAGAIMGPVFITGYIKVPIASVSNSTSSYGSGMITDAQRYRLPVHVAAFEQNASPPLGSHVAIRGHLRRNDNQNVILQVANMGSIHVIDAIVLSAEEMKAGFHVPELAKATTAIAAPVTPQTISVAIPPAIIPPAIIPPAAINSAVTSTPVVTQSLGGVRRTLTHPDGPGTELDDGTTRPTNRIRINSASEIEVISPSATGSQEAGGNQMTTIAQMHHLPLTPEDDEEQSPRSL